jgi:hypothetical protein
MNGLLNFNFFMALLLAKDLEREKQISTGLLATQLKGKNDLLDILLLKKTVVDPQQDTEKTLAQLNAKQAELDTVKDLLADRSAAISFPAEVPSNELEKIAEDLRRILGQGIIIIRQTDPVLASTEPQESVLPVGEAVEAVESAGNAKKTKRKS